MPEVKFIPRPIKTYGLNVAVVMNSVPTEGEIGLEIEVEGNNLPKPAGFEKTQIPVPVDNTEFWAYVKDHSLRGNDNAEYILTKPVMFFETEKALAELWEEFKKAGSTFDDSNRTSVHVHLNCQGFHFNRLTTFMAAYYALEEVLTEWCGEHRVGNLFCLRAVDAPAIISHLKKFIRSDGDYPLHDILRYAGLNPHSLSKFGSIEIRTLRGCSDPQEILTWTKILQRIYELSDKFPDPRELPAMFSSGGPLSFFDFLLGDQAQAVRDGVSWNNNQISDAMFRGIRFAQDIVYCRDWDGFKKQNVKPDPFGRNSKQVAQKLMSIDDSSLGEMLEGIMAQEFEPAWSPQEEEPEDYYG